MLVRTSNLHGDLRFLRLTSAPQDERKQREQHKEPNNETQQIAPPPAASPRLLIIQEPFLLDHVEVLPLLPLPLPSPAGDGVVGGDLAGPGLEGAGESAGGGLAGVAADGGVGVRGGPGRADDGGGVE